MQEKVIYLYIKESPIGIKYLGKTTKNPYNYLGSGIYWTRHIKSHNYKKTDIKTTILFQSTNKDEFREMALYYSNLFNIVEDENWANLVVECGEGTIGFKHSPEAIEKIKKAGTGRRHTEESKLKMRNSCLGRPNPPEAVAKANKTKSLNPYKLTEEHKAKLLECVKNRIWTEEQRKKLSVAMTGKKMPEEHKKRLTELSRNRMHSQESRDKRRQKLLGRKLTVEQLKKQKDKICIKVVRIEDGTIFNSIKEASDSEGIGYSALNTQLIRNSKKCKFKYFKESQD